METILREIIDELKAKGELDEKSVAHILQKHNRLHALEKNASHATGRVGACTAQRTAERDTASRTVAQPRKYAKKHLMPFYLKVKNNQPETWSSWNLSPQQEESLLKALRMKPRRTASGVATITVITKPWPCGSDCLYCPNDVRMPKSYLSDEPACQRAERNFFDPYLQVASRLRALEQMGHPTDKIELIVLGGTWSDYPQEYQIWFVAELFRALNDAEATESWNGESPCERTMQSRRAQYEAWGVQSGREQLERFAHDIQQRVDIGELTYNQAIAMLYRNAPWQNVAAMQSATFDQLEAEHRSNETTRHRAVGLVVETRPDAVNPQTLTMLRRLGCTKVQMGIQSLDPRLLRENTRGTSIEAVRRAFALLRLFGFKIHAHFMVNLLGATPDADKADYLKFVSDPAYLPDEVKLYPCVLVNSARLCAHHESGAWQPYSEEDLVDVLATDVLATPPFTRVSRMIRDISAHDIVAGNKKTNLRQMVESSLEQDAAKHRVEEIRYREIGTEGAADQLTLDTVKYETAVSTEYFLQWITPENRIAGFLRLSLPHGDSGFFQTDAPQDEALPILPHEAMIREVHVYGNVAKLHATGSAGEGAQHLGLGKRLIETACGIAKENGYTHMNVISAVGTREYYRSLGFEDRSLYQQRTL